VSASTEQVALQGGTHTPHDHEAPLRWLAGHLHGGRTLEERVRRLRWKRRRGVGVAAPTTEPACECAPVEEVAP
jgi:hypothetical protein